MAKAARRWIARRRSTMHAPIKHARITVRTEPISGATSADDVLDSESPVAGAGEFHVGVRPETDSPGLGRGLAWVSGLVITN